MKKSVSIFSKIFLAPLISFLFIKKITGKKNIPNRNFILASNHQSYLDILLCGCVCVPRRFTFIGQADRGESGFKLFRDLIYIYGEVIPVNRNDSESKKIAFKKAIEFLKNGYDLIIYPEGTRTRTGEIQEGKWGAAKLYLETGVPILPMGIKGAYEIFPPGQGLKIKKNVELFIGQPLSFEEDFERAKKTDKESDEYKDICASITEQVMQKIKKLIYEN